MEKPASNDGGNSALENIPFSESEDLILLREVFNVIKAKRIIIYHFVFLCMTIAFYATNEEYTILALIAKIPKYEWKRI